MGAAFKKSYFLTYLGQRESLCYFSVFEAVSSLLDMLLMNSATPRVHIVYRRKKNDSFDSSCPHLWC